jgi:ribosome-associated toxin RatA of RatAB toxin-antitoxin module
MKTVHKSALLNHSPQRMFDLVTDVGAYPQFLPWCDQASVLVDSELGMTAQVGISLAGLRQSFTTRNSHTLAATPRDASLVHMALVDGPFSHLEGEWTFTPLGEPNDQGQVLACKVNFTLTYAFASKTLALLVGPVFDKIASTMVEAFVTRADASKGLS